MPIFVAALAPCSARLPRSTEKGSGRKKSTALSYNWPAPSDASAAAAGTVTNSSGVAACGPAIPPTRAAAPPTVPATPETISRPTDT